MRYRSGGQSSEINGTGTSGTVELVPPANHRAFKKSTAIANATIVACTISFDSCAVQQVNPTIASAELGASCQRNNS